MRCFGSVHSFLFFRISERVSLSLLYLFSPIIFSLQSTVRHSASLSLTVVLIHIRHATLAPIAHAPAVPPLSADAPALFKTSLSVRFSDVDIVLYCWVDSLLKRDCCDVGGDP
jgi:hypothetical protein